MGHFQLLPFVNHGSAIKIAQSQNLNPLANEKAAFLPSNENPVIFIVAKKIRPKLINKFNYILRIQNIPKISINLLIYAA